MGGAKREMMRHEDLVGLATEVALKAQAVTSCPMHDDIILEVLDPDADRRAYAIGTNMVKAGEVDGTREEFMAAIKEAIEMASEECCICAKHRDD